MNVEIKFMYSEIFDKATYKAMEKYYNKKLPLYSKEKLIKFKENLENFWKSYRKIILKNFMRFLK